MGTIAYYVGDNDIPEEKRDEFAQAIIKILREGGMMKIHNVSMFDKSIHLLSPVELDSNGEVQFYNYSSGPRASGGDPICLADDCPIIRWSPRERG